ncbi:MAG: hypothetical protein QOH57_5438 [Mycobacterium sp.]|nr:hypothetical protein [Mycobacterium sp.]
MMRVRYLSVRIGVASVGAAALLFATPGSFTAKAPSRTIPEIRSAASVGTPLVTLEAGNIPYVVGLAGLGGSIGGLGWTVDPDLGPGGNTINTASVVQTANQLGPATLNFSDVKNINFSLTPSATNPTGSQPVFHAGDTAPWVVGMAGLGESTGTLEGAVNNTFGGGNGGIADAAGSLQTANRLGPAFFDLNVLKAITFTQPVNGAVLPNGQTDDIRAVDIGRWQAGIPGVITNTGTTGFVIDRGYGVNFGTLDASGGLHTTTQIGSQTFDFDLLPAISFPSFAFSPSGNTLVSDPPPNSVSPLPGISPDPGARTAEAAPSAGSTEISPSSLSPGSVGSNPRTIGPGPNAPIPASNGFAPRTVGTGAPSPGTLTGLPSLPGLPGVPDLPKMVTGALSGTGSGSNSSTGTGTNSGFQIPGFGGPAPQAATGSDPGAGTSGSG